jgi:hypothetical protein
MNYKQMIQSLLPGWDGRLAVHHVGFLADGHVHRSVPYNATDPKVIMKKLDLMKSVGVDIVIHTWQGPYAASCHLDATLMSGACAQLGMQFALLLDPWCAKLSAKGQTSPSTANVITALQAPSTQTMLNASSYVPEKYILNFNTGADLVALGKAFPTYKFLAQGKGFSWIDIPPITDSPARNAAAVVNLKAQHANTTMEVASVCFSFDDSGMPLPANVQTQTAFDAAGGSRDLTKSVWGGAARILESYSGQFGEQQIATISPTTPIIAILTWDDYDEQSSGPLEKVIAQENGIIW